MGRPKKGIKQRSLDVSGIYIHYKKENWDKSHTIDSGINYFKDKDYDVQKYQMSKGMTPANRFILAEIKQIVLNKQKVEAAFEDFRTSLESMTRSSESLFKQGAVEGLRLHQFFSTSNTKKLEQLVSSDSQALDNIIILKDFIDSFGNVNPKNLSFLKEQGIIPASDLRILQSAYDKLKALISKMQSGAATPQMVVQELKSFTGKAMNCIQPFIKDFGTIAVQNAVGVINDNVTTKTKFQGKGVKTSYTPLAGSRVKRTNEHFSLTKMGSGAMIQVDTSIQREKGIFRLAILGQPGKFSNNKLSGATSFKDSQNISYTQLFGQQAGTGRTSGRVQNWFLNSYIHAKASLKSNSVFMRFIRSRAVALMDRSLGQKLFFQLNGEILTLDEMMDRHMNLIEKYINVNYNTEKEVVNKWVGQKGKKDAADAEKRSQEIYKAIKDGVSFSINMNLY